MANRQTQHPFLYITLATIIGISIGASTSLELHRLFVVLGISSITFAILWKRSDQIFNPGVYFTLGSIAIFIIIGIALVQIRNPENQPQHFIHHTDFKQTEKKGLQFEVIEQRKSSSYYEKYTVRVLMIDTIPVSGKILLNIKKDTTDQPLKIGHQYCTLGSLKPISKTLNPGQFDYSEYLKTHYIVAQLTQDHNELIYQTTNTKSIRYWTAKFRTFICSKLQKSLLSKPYIKLTQAYILGQRNTLDTNTTNAFRDSGTIHILAVSGLHVGIVFYILSGLLSPLTYFKKGKVIHLIILLLLLWGYASITGFSISVLRATTMFSIYSIGKHLQSRKSFYRAVLISAFIILCLDPMSLFQVGFQLSYIAVIAIVTIQPIFRKIYIPKFYIDKKLWETFTVTCSAQLGILPLSLYYFHQFPLLFFVANIIIIPFLGLLFTCGSFILVLSITKISSNLLFLIYEKLLDGLLYVINWAANQKQYIITDISFHTTDMICWYFILIFSWYAINYRKLLHLKIIGATCFLYFIMLCNTQYKLAGSDSLTIFHTPQYTTLGFRQGKTLQIFAKDTTKVKSINYITKAYKVHKNIKTENYEILKNVYTYKNQTIFILDHSSLSGIKIKPEIIILSSSPKVHLGQIIKELDPKLIIADGSNFKNEIDRWEKICRKNQISFHRTDQKGAFTIP